MNKSQIIKAVANNFGLSKNQVKSTINEFLDIIEEQLVESTSVTIQGFGTFSVIKWKASRHTKTGELINTPKRKFVKFKPSVNLKRAVQWQ